MRTRYSIPTRDERKNRCFGNYERTEVISLKRGKESSQKNSPEVELMD